MAASVSIEPLAAASRRAAPAYPAPPRPLDVPLVIAHRGASGYRPEHTLAAYRLAIRMGADFVEPDLVSTRDGVLVARHENEISGTTDVADHPRFAERETTKTVDGRRVTGWFTEDFTLAELRALRARERLPGVRPRNTCYDGHLRVPTLDEILALVDRESRRRGRAVGVYPETKHPSYLASVGLCTVEPLARALRERGLDRPDARVFVQSFEAANLRALAETVRVPLVQLVAGAGVAQDLADASDPRAGDDLVTSAGLREVSTYAAAIGPDKRRVLGRDAGGALGPPTSLVDDAHAAGLRVHAYTFRDENRYLPAGCRTGDDPHARGAAAEEYAAFFDAGVDGVFSDFTDTAVTARRAWLARRALAPARVTPRG